jgi:hypothetical protein
MSLTRKLVFGLPFAALTAWASAAVAWRPSGPDAVSATIATGLAVGCALVAFGPLPRPLRGALVRASLLAVTWGSVVAWFLWTPAPRTADWQPDVAQVADFDLEGDRVTVSGVRNFRYRTSDIDAEPRWEDRSFDLSRIRTVDLFFSFWGPRLICHNFVSFGFLRDDGTMDYVAVSIEARKRVGQAYSAIGGLFRQFTLIYVWADERDLVGVRTRFRGERVHRYRVEATPQNVRILFERYMADTMHLASSPRWYNAVTENCGVDILRTAWGQSVPLVPGPATLLNGTWEEQAWAEGRIEPAGTLEETLRAADVTEDSRAAADGEFSRAIRARDVRMRMGPHTIPP